MPNDLQPGKFDLDYALDAVGAEHLKLFIQAAHLYEDFAEAAKYYRHAKAEYERLWPEVAKLLGNENAAWAKKHVIEPSFKNVDVWQHSKTSANFYDKLMIVSAKFEKLAKASKDKKEDKKEDKKSKKEDKEDKKDKEDKDNKKDKKNKK